MEPVLTHRAKTVVDAARLHRAKERRARGLTLVEGPDLIDDVVAAGAEIVDLFGPSGRQVDDRALERLAGTKNPRGPVAVVSIPTEWLDRNRSLIVAVGVSDPGNVGSMIRTAASFGWGFAYTTGTADPWSPKTIRAGAGGQFQTPVARIGGLSEVGEWLTIATSPRGGDPSPTVNDDRVALLVGEEASGLSDTVIESANRLMTISTPGATESLNVAVATGIAVYELSKHSGQDSPSV